MKRDENMFNEMVNFFGRENIPNPEQYPIRFEFLTKSFEHHKYMETNGKTE